MLNAAPSIGAVHFTQAACHVVIVLLSCQHDTDPKDAA